MITEVTMYRMRCDGCDQSLPFDHDVFDSEGDAREVAPNLDWRTDGERDWCVACQKADHECVPDPEDPEICARCMVFLGDDEPEEASRG